jgi:predicted permease
MNPLRAMLTKRRKDRELDDELRAHFDMLVDQNLERGIPLESARRAARLELGGADQIKESVHDQRGLPFLESIAADVRYGARMLRKSPGFTAVAVLTLAFGIGANTAIFSLIDAVFLKSPPYPHSEQIAMVWEDVHLPHYQDSQDTPAPGNFADWKKRNTVFGSLAAIGYRSWNLTGSGEPVRIEGEAFSSEIFEVLQTYPALGQAFTPEEDRAGEASHVALLGYGLWTSRFGSDPAVVGRNILLDGEDYKVVGVMPPGFHFPDPDDQLYVPLALTDEALANHGSHYLRVVARLKPGVTLARAQSEMTLIARQLTQQYPDSNTGVGVSVVALRDQTTGSIRRPLFVLSGVVGLLLLMVCANIGNLLFARASVREREFAVRTALGASRARVVRQLLVESVLLAVLGGGLGLAFAFWGMFALRDFAPVDPAFTQTRLDANVCLFTLAASLLSAFIFGLVPAFQSSGDAVAGVLQEGSRGSASPVHLRVRGLLTIIEMALGVVVLIGTGLLLRSFVHLESIPLGFQPENVLSVRVILRGPRYDTLAQRTAFYQHAFDRIAHLPGVHAVSGISFLPLTLNGRTTGISIEGQPPLAAGQLPFADLRAVAPDYFPTMVIPLLQGRDFSWAGDTPSTPPIVIISQTMAHTFWPKGSAIAKRIKLGTLDEKIPWITVVGVVGDVRQLSLAVQPRPAMYFPVTQDVGIGDTLRDWVVRASGDPVALASAIRSAVWSLDPTLPVSRIQTMEQVRSSYLGPQRFELSLVALFGILGLILAAVGLYGVTAYSVSRRTHEIGIRMTLGAQQRDVMRLVIGNGAKLALIGVAAGTLAALALTHVMNDLLFGVTPTDPATFSAVALLLILVALAACYIPARRAMRVDPMVALRHE